MKLQFNYETERQDIGFDITVSGKTQRINSINSKVDFELSHGVHSIVIRQIFPKRANKFLSLVIFLLTMVFQGLLHILFLDTDNKWYLDATPFYIYARFEVHLKDDMEVNLKYNSSAYDGERKVWSFPEILMEGMNEVSIQYVADKFCIKNEFRKFEKKMTSAVFVGIVAFAFFLYKSVTFGNISLCICLVLIICAIIAICVIVLYGQYNTMQLLHKAFVEQLERQKLLLSQKTGQKTGDQKTGDGSLS